MDTNSLVTHHKPNRQLPNSSSRTDLLAKPMEAHSPRVNPLEFDRLKLDSTGTGDQQLIHQKKISSQPSSRSPDASIRHRIPLNTIDHCNGLLTYVSQQYSNAAAPGTPSAFSQWSPHNGETLTDDDLMKGNKNHSSRTDERVTTLSGERTSPSNTRPHRSSSRTFHIASTNKQTSQKDLNYEDSQPHYRLPSKHQRTLERNSPVPFGTYVRNTNHYHRRTPSPFQYSRN